MLRLADAWIWDSCSDAAPKLFAAPLIQQRDGTWAFVGFLNQEPEGILSFEILDPIPVGLRDGALQGL